MEEQQVNANEWKKELWSQISEGELTKSSIEGLLNHFSLKMKDITAFVVAKLCEVDGNKDLEASISIALKTIGLLTAKKDKKRKRRECVTTFENLSRLIGPINADMTALCMGADGIEVAIPGAILSKNIHSVFLDHIGVMEEWSGDDYSNPTIQERPTCCSICKKTFYVVGNGSEHVNRFCIVCLNDYVDCKIVEREKNSKRKAKCAKEDRINNECTHEFLRSYFTWENADPHSKEAKHSKKNTVPVLKNSKWVLIVPKESSSWKKSITRDVQRALEASKGKEIISVGPICSDRCLESYPCQGHRGVIIRYEYETDYEMRCSSVSIAAIQKCLTGKIELHFRQYESHFDAVPAI